MTPLLSESRLATAIGIPVIHLSSLKSPRRLSLTQQTLLSVWLQWEQMKKDTFRISLKPELCIWGRYRWRAILLQVRRVLWDLQADLGVVPV